MMILNAINANRIELNCKLGKGSQMGMAKDTRNQRPTSQHQRDVNLSEEAMEEVLKIGGVRRE